MNVIDIGIISITFISCVISILRGLIKEVVSIASWTMAFFISTRYAQTLSTKLHSSVGNETVSFTISLVAIFVFVLILGLILNILLGFIISKTGLGPFDKVLGIFFGFLRAIIIISIFVFIGMITDFRKSELWQDSKFIPNFIQVIDWLGMDDLVDLDAIKDNNMKMLESI